MQLTRFSNGIIDMEEVVIFAFGLPLTGSFENVLTLIENFTFQTLLYNCRLPAPTNSNNFYAFQTEPKLAPNAQTTRCITLAFAESRERLGDESARERGPD